MSPSRLTPEQREKVRDLVDHHGVAPAAAMAQVLEDTESLALLEDTPRECECGSTAHVPRHQTDWTCGRCGRIHRGK